ncbi:MAG TPA: kynureninase [Caulobacteraceae bacterium]|nr:kynureninase [Caulobacteraceae bacterium]
MDVTRQDCAELDAADPLGFARERFSLPAGVIYLDGNSLGALPRATPQRLAEVVAREWGHDLIRSWNTAGWIDLPARVGARIANLIGADADEVVAADSTSVNLFKLASAAVRRNAPRRVVLAEAGDFPTDLYMLQGLEAQLGGAIEFRPLPRQDLIEAIGPEVALVVLTQVNYRTGEVWDMAAVDRRAREAGALTLWDLSHSAGVLDVRLNADGADLAVGCGYKYLNGGPGAPAFLFVAKRLQGDLQTPLSGWMGHAAPFAFADRYEPAAGVRRMLCGTPTILGLAALEEGLKSFDGVSMAEARAKAARLGDLFLERVEARLPGVFSLGCPRAGARRGGQVSLRHPHGYPIMQALIERGVVGDFRAPDVLRFGFAPLYVRHVDAFDAAERLAEVMESGAWREPRYAEVAAVT